MGDGEPAVPCCCIVGPSCVLYLHQAWVSSAPIHSLTHTYLRCSLVLCLFLCSGNFGSGEFIVTLLLMALCTVVFFWKMVKFVNCPDKLERKRRKEVMLKNYLLSQKSTLQ